MGDTKIEWTDKTWNPIRARNLETNKVGHYCQKVSPGCAGCYAERMNLWRGTGVPYAVDKLAKVELFLDEETLREPLSWKKPKMVFVCSMTDLFAEFVPIEWIDRIFAVMSIAENHTFQVLTKRPLHALTYLKNIQDDEKDTHRWAGEACSITNSPCAAGLIEDRDWPLPNVWLGVSAENQATADARIPLLLQTPAAVRFLSCEPLLGPIDLYDLSCGDVVHGPCGDANCHDESCRDGYDCIDWVIVGGESGQGARPMHPAWARQVRDQCNDNDVAFFFKQWGEWAPAYELDHDPNLQARIVATDELPRHEFAEGTGGERESYKVGKKNAGRTLDGRTWDEMPAPKGVLA